MHESTRVVPEYLRTGGAGVGIEGSRPRLESSSDQLLTTASGTWALLLGICFGGEDSVPQFEFQPTRIAVQGGLQWWRFWGRASAGRPREIDDHETSEPANGQTKAKLPNT